jgi:hypothetical protein
MPEIMFIEQICPAAVAEKSTLHERLFAEGEARGLSNEYTKAIVSIVPKTLIEAGAFLDKMTSLWRYEFGMPYDIAGDLFWGIHMWVPVENLFTALFCAYSHIPENKRATYLAQLADPEKHQNKLVEMIPVAKVDSTVTVEFEVSGSGAGKRTVDWVIGPYDGRTVLLDVKRRTTDFVKQAEGIVSTNAVQEPNHDAALLFRSIEQKFLSAEPNSQLQGAWIVTDIKQEEDQLVRAFTALDESKVHYAILGDWKPDVYVLARRDYDRQYLLNLFHIYSSTRFTFTNSK